MHAPLLAIAAAALLQQPTASRVARIVVTPANPVVVAGDTLRLRAEALDSAGRPIANALVHFFASAYAEELGAIDETTGLLHAGFRGFFPVRVVAGVPGSPVSRPQAVTVQIVPPPAARIAVSPSVGKLLGGQHLKLTGEVFAANGDRRDDEVRWSSSNPRIVRVESDGRLAALAPGTATVTAAAGPARQTLALQVVPNTIRRVEITGGAATAKTGDVLHFRVSARDAAGREVAGVAPMWTMAPGNGVIDQDGLFVANEAGEYSVTASLGTFSAETSVKVTHREVRRPTTTMGRVPVHGMPTAEFWPHPNGRNAYLSTIGDRVYALDISDPANPRVTDSVMVDARIVNDVMTTADGRWAVMSREGASNRRNGIVILSLEDPAHPRQVAEYTETVTGGVHSSYVYTQPRYGTHVYLTDDATGSMRVIDLNDPLHPREIARWETRQSEAGRYLHDIDVQDGLAYLSYWNDGLVILDIGNGVRGGSPSSPQLVAQFKYNLEDLYRNVEAEGGTGFIRGTHTAWRHGSYVFVGDEVFTARPLGVQIPGLPLGKANGRLHVVDVSDLANPREVAWFEPADGGSHNVWVAGDTLYLGDYQGGLRVLDISGELRGDLQAQDREIAHVHTGDARGFLPNAAMAWGAFYVNGMVYVNDVFSGLWVIRVDPRQDPRRPEPGIP